MTFETADGVVPLYRAAALNEPASTARTNAKMPVERYASFIGSRASTCAIAFASAERPGRGRARSGSDPQPCAGRGKTSRDLQTPPNRDALTPQPHHKTRV